MLTMESAVTGAPFLTTAQTPDAVTLRVGAKVMTYRGGAVTLLRDILPHLEVTKSVLEIAEDLGGLSRHEAVMALCRRLVQDGFVVQVSTPQAGALDISDDLFWTGLGSPNLTQQNDKRTMRIIVVGSPSLVDETRRVVSGRWTVETATFDSLHRQKPDSAAVVVAWIADPNSAEIAEWNAHAYHYRQPWLPIVQFDGEVAIVGPFIIPPETPCFECYRRRRAARNTVGERYLTYRNVKPLPMFPQPLAPLMAAIAAIQLDIWFSSESPHIPGALQAITFDEGLSLETEYVLRVPRCEACRPATAAARPTLWTETFGRAHSN